MKTKVMVVGDIFDHQIIDELNSDTSDFIYEHIADKELTPTTGIELLIVYELARNLAYNAAYDILKSSLTAIITKIKSKHQGKKHSRLTVIYDGKKCTIDFPFDLTESHKDKIVDAVMEDLRKRGSC